MNDLAALIAIERLLTGIVWVVLIVVTFPAFRRAVARPADLKSVETVMGCVCLLCFNRLTFTITGAFLPDSDAATAMCYVLAFVFGLFMLAACRGAIRRDRR